MRTLNVTRKESYVAVFTPSAVQLSHYSIPDPPSHGQLSRRTRSCKARVNRIQKVQVCCIVQLICFSELTDRRLPRCDRPMPLGVNLTSLTKVLKCAKDDDTCTLKASDDGDLLNFTYEARSAFTVVQYVPIPTLTIPFDERRHRPNCRVRAQVDGYRR